MAKKLTKRQRYWLKHIQIAVERGEPLKAYAKRCGISIGALYKAKSGLIDSGVLPRRGRKLVSAQFVPVRIEPSVVPRPRCKLRHRSGWELECEGWPDPRWLLALVQEEHDDAST